MTSITLSNATLSNPQLNKLTSGIKSGVEVTLNLSSNLVGDTNDETNFPNKLLLTGTQVSRLCKEFANGSSANVKLSKTQLSKMMQLKGFFSDIWYNGYDRIRSSKNGSKKDAPKLVKNAAKYLVIRGTNELNKKFKTREGSGITLTNNEIKKIYKSNLLFRKLRNFIESNHFKNY